MQIVSELLSGPELINSYIGESEKNIRAVFEQVSAAAAYHEGVSTGKESSALCDIL